MKNFEEYERNHKKKMAELKEQLDVYCDFIGTEDAPFDVIKEYMDEAIQIADEMNKLDSLHKRVLLGHLKDEKKRLFNELSKIEEAQ